MLHRVLTGTTTALVVAVALLVAVAILPGLVGLAPVIVISGSMEPTLHVGDIAVTRSVAIEKLKVGDVVTYHSGSSLITHRIIRIEETPQGQLLELKGDANVTSDSELVPAERVAARVLYGVPKIGLVVAFANSQTGLTLLIIGPAVILALMWYREREVRKARS
jgi:signal peptidase I